jgi:hypothetical protein
MGSNRQALLGLGDSTTTTTDTDAVLRRRPEHHRGAALAGVNVTTTTAAEAAAATVVASSGKDDAVGDIGGGGGGSSSGKGGGAAARAQFDEAMAGLPPETKGSYAEALRRNPHLVEAESNPDLYMAYDQHDPWRAALRVAAYWTTRAEIFGDDRAYRPLTLSGHGALSPEDVKLFHTGFLMILPNDRHGRAVVRVGDFLGDDGHGHFDSAPL